MHIEIDLEEMEDTAAISAVQWREKREVTQQQSLSSFTYMSYDRHHHRQHASIKRREREEGREIYRKEREIYETL
jgi:hypothetical protein